MSISNLFKYKNSHYIHKVLLISLVNFYKKSSAKSRDKSRPDEQYPHAKLEPL